MPPPPPPPRQSLGGGGYYSSSSNNNAAAGSSATRGATTSSSAASRQRLGLNSKATTTTSSWAGGTAAAATSTAPSSSDGWFSSAPSAPAPTPAPNSGSGFYSMNNIHSNASANHVYGQYSTGGGGGYYGNLSNDAMMGVGGSGGGGIMQSNSNMMSGAMNTNNYQSTSSVTSSLSNANKNNYTNMMMMTGGGAMASISGPIGGGPSSSSSGNNTLAQPHIFDPNVAKHKQQEQQTSKGKSSMIDDYFEEDYTNEPPLLEELGVNFPHIYAKSRAVLFPIGTFAKSLDHGLIEDDADLAGPLAFALGLGGELLLAGKMHFGYVYGFGLSGCLAMTILLNLLNPNGAVSMWTVVSILGYALLPVNLLAGINVLYRVHKMNVMGMALAVVIILWCTAASTRLFERGCQMRDQRFLVAYPAALLYSAFVMITIF